jgi:hypothetical protein
MHIATRVRTWHVARLSASWCSCAVKWLCLGNHPEKDKCTYTLVCLEWPILRPPRILTFPPETPCLCVCIYIYAISSVHVSVFNLNVIVKICVICPVCDKVRVLTFRIHWELLYVPPSTSIKCILPIWCIYGFCMILTVKGDCFPKQHHWVGCCDGDGVCFLWSTEWILKYSNGLQLCIYILHTGAVIDTEYVGVLISLWLFLFATQPKQFFWRWWRS